MEAKTNCSHSSRSEYLRVTLIRWIKGAAWFKFKHTLLLFLQRVFSVWGEETSLCPTLLPTCCLTYICSWEACSSRNSVFAVVSVEALQAQVWFWFMNLKASVGHFCVRKEKLKVHSLVLRSPCCLLLCRPEDTWTTCSDDYSVSHFFISCCAGLYLPLSTLESRPCPLCKC